MVDPYAFLTNDEMAVLKAYYHARKQGHLGREWTDERKKIIKKILSRLSDEGWLINGLYPSGSLMFSRIVKSPLQRVTELPEKDFRDYQKGILKLIDGEFVRVESGSHA